MAGIGCCTREPDGSACIRGRHAPFALGSICSPVASLCSPPGHPPQPRSVLCRRSQTPKGQVHCRRFSSGGRVHLPFPISGQCEPGTSTSSPTPLTCLRFLFVAFSQATCIKVLTYCAALNFLCPQAFCKEVGTAHGRVVSVWVCLFLGSLALGGARAVDQGLSKKSRGRTENRTAVVVSTTG